MRMAALLVVVIAGAAAAAAASPEHGGRVVRVERGHGGLHRTPRICQIQAAEGRGTCWGKPPVIGEIASVVDQTGGVLGELRVTAVNAGLDRCGKQQNWDYAFVRESGQLEKAQLGYSFSVFDVEVAPGRTRALTDPSRVASPSGKTGEQVWSALDRDGDGSVDFLVTAYPCDKMGDLATGAAAGLCLDYWNLDHADWRKLRHDFVETCM
jgi:hypothetical protein